MLRLRVFRILLPVLLLPFLVVLFLQLEPKPPVHNVPSPDKAPGRRVEGMDYVEFAAGKLAYAGKIGVVHQQPDGHVELEEIRRFEIEREDADPLIVRAETGGIDGKPGERKVRLLGSVEVREEGEGLVVELPQLEIDQARGEARSVGDVRLASPGYTGHADSLVYGLRGQPTLLHGVRMQSEDGAVLVARRARLVDGSRDVELEGEVRVERGAEQVAAELMRVWSWPEGGPRKIVARGGVEGALQPAEGGLVELQSEELEAEWDQDGEPRRVLLVGHATVSQSGNSISASWLEAERGEGRDRPLNVVASGAVRASGRLANEPVELSSQELLATFAGDGELRSAEASGAVEYTGLITRAEAENARLTAGTPLDEVELLSGSRRRARMARGNTTVVADRIVTDELGLTLDAEGRVEATLLPSTSRAESASSTDGLFRADAAIHFVSSRLQGEQSGSLLHFSGEVRGWQGDRTLSADSVRIDQRDRSVQASGDVGTRLPREEEGGAVSQADYVQISAERLDYREDAARAVYEGGARVRQAEGWLESERLELDLETDRNGIREIRGFGQVRLEYRAPGEKGTPNPVTGQGDRVVYTLANQTLRLYGDENPASAVRRGANGGSDTTAGRVLRYRLDSGTLTVESGDQDRVRIRTSGRPS